MFVYKMLKRLKLKLKEKIFRNERWNDCKDLSMKKIRKNDSMKIFSIRVS